MDLLLSLCFVTELMYVILYLWFIEALFGRGVRVDLSKLFFDLVG